MTSAQKQSIKDLRLQGLGYTQIASSLGLSVNTVKSFCRRNSLMIRLSSESAETEENKENCKQCGKRLEQKPGQKTKKFCRDGCRFAWWNSHRDRLKRKAAHHPICAHCGRVFENYGNKTRKYCTHACYIKDRFGEEAHRDNGTI